jgi:hypothetical protein
MKKMIFVSSFLLLLGISALAFTQNSVFTHYLLNMGQNGSEQIAKTESDGKEHSVKTNNPDSQMTDLTIPKPTNEPIPDEVAIEIFLARVISLERAAAKAEAKGESGKLWRNYLERHGFTDNEANVIRGLANEFIKDILPLHQKALEIIKNGRAAMKKGTGLQLPPELKQMQQNRNALAARYKNRLQQRLGSGTVEKAKLLMQQNSKSFLTDSENPLTEQERLDLRQQRQNSIPNRKGGQNQ